MAIKVQFEIGHTATVKTKRTPEGFTHDWELYVQGVNKADISAFVDKVVFNLHDSFPRPKRSIKEPPYVIKESGYAGFVLNIDIYFRNRDEPKRVTYVYDLDLQHEGPPYHRCEIKKFIFEAPSDDFRQKLVKGGGIAVSAVVGGAITNDDKSLDMSIPDNNRSQMVGKPKLSIDATSSTSSSSSKKHKQRPDDSKLNTFANLFGTPITKSAPKFSPDPKTKTANGGAIGPTAPTVPGKGKDKSSSATGGATAGTVSSGPVAGSGKDKEKAEKKEKHKQSPHKDKLHDEKESKKKFDAKHEKREEKKKDKKDKEKEKERERAKDKPSKRSLSPKSAAASAPSPKRPSPVRSSSAASRDDASAKSSSKNSESDKRGSSSSSGKKSKKEKKSHDKEREHKDKHRTEVKESVPAPSVAPAVATTPAVSAVAPAVQQPSKTTGSSTVAPKTDLNSNKNPKASEKDKDSKKTDSKSSEKESTPVQGSDKKTSTEKDKKSHKHKKKDKNKEKEKEKEKDKDQTSKKSTSNKDKKEKKDKTAKNDCSAPSTTTASNTNSAAISKKSTVTTTDGDILTDPGGTKSTACTTGISSTKTASTTNKQSNNFAATMVSVLNSNTTANTGTGLSASGLSTAPNDLSDVDSINSESLHAVSNSNSDKVAPIQNSDSSNSSFPEVPTTVSKPASVPVFQAPANPQPTPPTTPIATAAPAPIVEPPRPTQTTPVLEKKPHRSTAEKSKAEKTAEKEDKKRRRNSTAVNTFVEPPLKQTKKDLKPAREKSQSPLLRTEEKQTFLPPPATTSTLPIQNTPVTALNLEYLSELQELHQKIMTLQDNEELQQVVEMIAATGRYEITSKTFDFDLCKLDRHTVQRLQDFFATSVS